MEIIAQENALWTRKWNRQQLQAMAVNPSTLFAYWEISTTQQMILSEHFQVPWENLPLFLQLHDVTNIDFDGSNALTTQRFAVASEADHWYFHQLLPQRMYVVDIGTTTYVGNFFLILRSNYCMIPGRSSRQASQFMPQNSLNQGWDPETGVYEDVYSGSLATSGSLPPQNPLTKFPYHHEFNGYSITKGGNAT